MTRLAAVVCLATLGTLTGAARLGAADPFAGFDEAVAKGLKAHDVPGVGIAVVKDGKILFAKGYGVRKLGQSDPVTEKSLFAIGSVSKSFTATAMAMLVDEGKVKWDDPLAKHLQSLRLPDPYLTQEVTLRDVLSHRVGIARNEMIWYGSPFDRTAVLEKLKGVKPGAKLRTKFVYNNILYMAAGQVVPSVASGKSWDDFVAERLFRPLKMTTANTSIQKLPKDADVATPHEKLKGKATAIDWKNIDNIGPAGSINACAADMAEYVKFHLTEGKGPEKRLLERSVFRELHRPQTLMPEPGFSFAPGSHYRAYGLGWMLADYKGKRLVEHGGNIDGMSAQVGMLPDEKLGVVVLANCGRSLLPQALMFDLFDRLLGEPDLNRAETTGLLAWVSEIGIQSAQEPAETSRVKDTKPSLALEKYAGRYEDDLHAPLRVKFADGKLTATFNGVTFDLDHWHYNTFRAVDKKGVFPKMLVTFNLGDDARVTDARVAALGEDVRLKRK